MTNELNLTDLVVVSEQKSITIQHNEGVYTFNYRDIPWNKRMELASNSLTGDGNSVSFNLGEYYLSSLLYMLDESTFPGLSPTLLNSLDSAVLDQLVSIVPSPWGIMDEVNVLKKE